MDFVEYTKRLNGLRDEYAASIKHFANTFNGGLLIERVQAECNEYRLRVANLITEYRG